ncbi:bile salt-activated lipase isoform X1 [Anoplophora glabripennis]|uniref:bile salt-activated lipase isoform X1 n=1 Tax=Anoplophora glabripennis TaxID=217634 RepID=UPI000C771892|nr:bile salt-activated lipase isoform X1 [Anoplophora glabripennis]
MAKWEGVKNVFEKQPECLQGGEDNIIGSEDCLFLKIYTTVLPKEQKKLPVMVWIYGGAFFAGYPNFTRHSPDLLLDQDVIIVGLHYRVGIFGFLSTGDLVVPGNNGLKDQILGLRWIKENIERFGGDPDNITIFGQSAGSASIGYLLQTPQTKDILRIVLATYDLQPSRLVPIDMNIPNILIRSSVGRQIKTQYFGSRLIATSNFEVMEFISNDQFARPIQETARLYSKYNPVYFYRFSHEGPLFGVSNRNFPGVGHTEDLGYIFDYGYQGSEVDYLVRSQMVKLWTNFAKTGNPTPEYDPLLQGIQWPLLTENNLDYLEIDRGLQALTKPDFLTSSFWKTLYNRNGNPPYGTY